MKKEVAGDRKGWLGWLWKGGATLGVVGGSDFFIFLAAKPLISLLQYMYYITIIDKTPLS